MNNAAIKYYFDNGLSGQLAKTYIFKGDKLFSIKKNTEYAPLEAKSPIIKGYYDSTLTSGGSKKMWDFIKKTYCNISKELILETIKGYNAYQLMQPEKPHNTVRSIIVKESAKVAQIDLIDVQELAAHNDQVRYLLTYVDLHSKYALIEPLLNKEIESVNDAVDAILQRMPFNWRPSTIQADNGSEFKQAFEDNLDSYDIKTVHSQPYNPSSQGAIERLNKTIKSMIKSYLIRRDGYRYIDELTNIETNINTSKHNSTGYIPIDVMQSDNKNAASVIANIKKKNPISKNSKANEFKVGDWVRVSVFTDKDVRKNAVFRKSLGNNWSREKYMIMNKSMPKDANSTFQYKLSNLNKKYYGYQLQLTQAEPSPEPPIPPVEPVEPAIEPPKPKKLKRIENVLGSKDKKGKPEWRLHETALRQKRTKDNINYSELFN